MSNIEYFKEDKKYRLPLTLNCHGFFEIPQPNFPGIPQRLKFCEISYSTNIETAIISENGHCSLILQWVRGVHQCQQFHEFDYLFCFFNSPYFFIVKKGLCTWIQFSVRLNRVRGGLNVYNGQSNYLFYFSGPSTIYINVNYVIWISI